MDYGDDGCEEEARSLQAEADAEEACYEQALYDRSEGRMPACARCGGCAKGKALLTKVDNERAAMKEQSAEA